MDSLTGRPLVLKTAANLSRKQSTPTYLPVACAALRWVNYLKSYELCIIWSHDHHEAVAAVGSPENTGGVLRP